MSYLNPLRLHFGGTFQANVSTVNNDTGHFDTGQFKPEYQKVQGPNRNPPNGGNNPTGDSAWRLLGCKVTGAAIPGQTDAAILACGIADSNNKVCAKMVDLDSQQQIVSEIWGLQFRITDPEGKTLLRADMTVAALIDLWKRATIRVPGDMVAAATYQSTLVNLKWADVVSFSPVLAALKQASAQNGKLSIKFNLDGVNIDFTSPNFMCGRIVGTVGPVVGDEPTHLVLGRQFMTSGNWSNFFIPSGKLNFCPGFVDESSNTLFLDLGNAFPTEVPGGNLNNLGDLTVTAGGTSLGTLAASQYTDPNWYLNTAGVVAFSLTPQQMQALATSPISITGNPDVFISEPAAGAYVRADKFVYRLSPGQSADVRVYAMQWGKPLPGAQVNFAFDNSQLQTGSLAQEFDCPLPGQPTDPSEGAPTFNSTATTNAQGVALLQINANNLGTVRVFNDGSSVDGQVYGIRPVFANASLNEPSNQQNNANFVSLLAWSVFNAPNPVTWEVVQPILQQYANLYPVMLNFLNLGDYAAVIKNRKLLQLAFGLTEGDPNSMPVTRDLSPARRAAILSWLDNPIAPAALPSNLAPVAKPSSLLAQPSFKTTAPKPDPAIASKAERAGKTAALANRMGRTLQQVTRQAQQPNLIRPMANLKGAKREAVAKALLQQALMLEHSTIPVYLYGLYSLDESKNKEIFSIIQSVVSEEMLHMVLVSNVLNALGGSPELNQPGFIPTFPGHLPGGVEGSLIVHLKGFSMEQLETYLDIEQPADPIEFEAMPEDDNQGMTIGKFYARIQWLIKKLGNDAFVPGPRNQIGPDQMHHAVVVTNVATAIQALETIVLQGEGTKKTPCEVVGHHYAHYYRFMEIREGRELRRVSTTGPINEQYTFSGPPIPFDSTGVYAVPDDPLASNYPFGTQQRNFCDRFNYTYTALLNALQVTLNGNAAYLDKAIGLMMSLRGLAKQMMSGTPNPAVITGPSFQYQPTDPAPWPPG